MSMHGSWLNQNTIDVLRLELGIENQICNAFKDARGQAIPKPIRLKTSLGDRFIQSVKTLTWSGSQFLVLDDAIVLTSKDQHIGGELVRIELDLRPNQRNGELEVKRTIR